MNFNDVAIVSIEGNDHFWCISKDDAINIINSSSLNKKTGLLYIFLLYIKDEWNNLS